LFAQYLLSLSLFLSLCNFAAIAARVWNLVVSLPLSLSLHDGEDIES
jgi:hypothetical protein